MNGLLIVEEALRDQKAHWFEYIQTISRSAEALGWEVDVACHIDVTSAIQDQLSTIPIFRYTKYLDQREKRLPGERYYGFLLHSLRCLYVLWPLLARQKRYEHIFAPTVLVHHLLAWWVILQFHPNRPQHLTLFFVTNPGVWSKEHKRSFLPKSAQLQGNLLKLFHKFVQQKRVTMGVETRAAKAEFETLTGLPFQLLPHPVPALNQDNDKEKGVKPQTIVFACYGFARHEKGSDLLKAAIERLLQNETGLNVCFRVQWIHPFSLPDGNICEPGLVLSNHPSVEIIDYPLQTKEYLALLRETDCMVLPYRNSSYHARLSRIAVEATFLGIPIIYTEGGWLQEMVDEFGAGIGIQDEKVDALIKAIQDMLTNHCIYQEAALKKSNLAKAYFSGENFCKMLLQMCNEKST